MVDNKRGHADCREDCKGAHLGDERQHEFDGPRACRDTFHPRPASPDFFVPWHVWIDQMLHLAGSPRDRYAVDHSFLNQFRAHCPIYCPVDHDKRSGAGRVRCCEKRRCCECARARDQGHFAAAENVEHGGDAVGPLLQGRQ